MRKMNDEWECDKKHGKHRISVAVLPNANESLLVAIRLNAQSSTWCMEENYTGPLNRICLALVIRIRIMHKWNLSLNMGVCNIHWGLRFSRKSQVGICDWQGSRFPATLVSQLLGDELPYFWIIIQGWEFPTNCSFPTLGNEPPLLSYIQGWVFLTDPWFPNFWAMNYLLGLIYRDEYFSLIGGFPTSGQWLTF